MGNFKNFHELQGFVALRESFLRKLWGHLLAAPVSNPQKSYFPPIRESVLLRNFPAIQEFKIINIGYDEDTELNLWYPQNIRLCGFLTPSQSFL